MIVKFITSFFLLLVCFIFSLSPVVAHVGGESFEEKKGNYLIDIGYEESITVGAPASFNFAITNITTQEDVPFTDVWVRIVKNGKALFATGLHRQEIGPTTLLYTFPEGGNYEISARFQNNEGIISESEFPLTVSEVDIKTSFFDNLDPANLVVGFIFGIIVGGITLKIFAGKKTKHTMEGIDKKQVQN